MKTTIQPFGEFEEQNVSAYSLKIRMALGLRSLILLVFGMNIR